MFGWFTLHVAALLLVAALFGGMLMFMAVFTPLVFRSLPAASAGAFLRDVFPVYYRVCGVLALLAALFLVPAHAYPVEIAVLLVVAAGFVLANRVLRPALNRAREEGRDSAFRRLHRLSVALHLAQFVIVAAVLIRLAQ
jgi:hypothetical protein